MGVTALFFEAARRRRGLEAALAARLGGAGYSEVVLPILDYFEPYEPLLPPATRSELYRFVDRDGELLALRADFTPMLARLVAPRLASFTLPLRFFYRGDVVRYQEERAGRMREFYQLGAELLGPSGRAADAEALRLFLELLDASDAPHVQVVLGFAGALDNLLLAAASPAAAPGSGHVGGELGAVELATAISRRERRVARRAGEDLLRVVEEGKPGDPRCLGAEAARRLGEIEDLVASLAGSFPHARLSIDLAEFAGFTLAPELRGVGETRGYYDGIVFRAYVGDRALPVGAGGRYDDLFGRLDAPVPAIGFSLGLDRLAQAAPEKGAR